MKDITEIAKQVLGMADQLDEASAMTKINALGYDTAQKALDTLSRYFTPDSLLAKGIVKEFGTGYEKDFKKLKNLLNDIDDVWEIIRYKIEDKD